MHVLVNRCFVLVMFACRIVPQSYSNLFHFMSVIFSNQEQSFRHGLLAIGTLSHCDWHCIFIRLVFLASSTALLDKRDKICS